MANKQDRKTRLRGDTVVHRNEGRLFQGQSYEPPRGLTAEQGEEERTGAKLGDRQVREGAQGDGQSTPWGDTSARRRPPIEHPTTHGTDEVAETKKADTPRRDE